MARRSFLSSAGLASAAALTAGYIPLRADDYPRLTPSRQFRVLTVNNAGGFRLCVHEGDLYYLSSNFQTGEQLLGCYTLRGDPVWTSRIDKMYRLVDLLPWRPGELILPFSLQDRLRAGYLLIQNGAQASEDTYSVSRWPIAYTVAGDALIGYDSTRLLKISLLHDDPPEQMPGTVPSYQSAGMPGRS